MIAGSRTTNVKYRRLVFLAVLAALAMSGCKRKEAEAGPPPAQTVSEAEIAAARNAMTQKMTAIAFGKLTAAHVGRRCVVTARTLEHADPPPPPLGMVRRMGATTIYSAEVHEVLPGGLKIRAAYPTSGNLKITEIPKADIQSIHVGD